MGINAKGGTIIFPEVFRELGWRQLLATASQGTDGLEAVVPPGGHAVFSRGAPPLPRLFYPVPPSDTLAVVVVSLVVAVVLLVRRSNRVPATASGVSARTGRACPRWRELRASRQLAAMTTGLVMCAMAAAHWTTWFKPSATSRTTLGLSDLALAGSPTLRFAMILNSPSYNMLNKCVSPRT